MTNRGWMHGALLLAFALPACAEGSEPTTDRGTAEAGWRSTETALGAAGLQTGWSGSANVNGEGAEGVVMGTVECPDGGSMTVDAAGSAGQTMVNGAVRIEFFDCGADGVVIAGVLDYEGSVTETEVAAEVHGDLRFSGKAEGSCAIDIEARVTLDGPSVGSASVAGNMCGHAWTDVFS